MDKTCTRRAIKIAKGYHNALKRKTRIKEDRKRAYSNFTKEDAHEQTDCFLSICINQTCMFITFAYHFQNFVAIIVAHTTGYSCIHLVRGLGKTAS